MNVKRTIGLGAIFAYMVTTVTVSSAAPRLDGAVILKSASTNTAAVTIKIWSDGHGQLELANAAPKTFQVSQSMTRQFFTDVRTARSNPGTPGHCMKSVSFGTSTVVKWHNYTSVDLQCPPFSDAVTALARDAQSIEQAAGIGTTVIPHPGYMRRTPIEGPSTPTPKATP
jgi:hypothetical protein